jgi:hypothetical protein
MKMTSVQGEVKTAKLGNGGWAAMEYEFETGDESGVVSFTAYDKNENVVYQDSRDAVYSGGDFRESDVKRDFSSQFDSFVKEVKSRPDIMTKIKSAKKAKPSPIGYIVGDKKSEENFFKYNPQFKKSRSSSRRATRRARKSNRMGEVY